MLVVMPGLKMRAAFKQRSKKVFEGVDTKVGNVGAKRIWCRKDFIDERFENGVFLAGLFSYLIILGAYLLKLGVGWLRRSQLSIEFCTKLQELVPIVRHSLSLLKRKLSVELVVTGVV